MTRSEYQAAAAEARRRKRRIPDPPERFDDDPYPGAAGAAPGDPPLPGPAEPAPPGATPGEAGDLIQVPSPPEPPDPREQAEEAGALEEPPPSPPPKPDDAAVEALVLAADSGLQRLPPGGPMSETERGLWRAAVTATMQRLGLQTLPLWAHWAAVGVGSLLPRLLAFRAHVWGGPLEKTEPEEERGGEGIGGLFSWLEAD